MEVQIMKYHPCIDNKLLDNLNESKLKAEQDLMAEMDTTKRDELFHTISIGTNAKNWISRYEDYKKKCDLAESDKHKTEIINEMFVKLSKSTKVVDGSRELNDQQYQKFKNTILDGDGKILNTKLALIRLN